MRSLHLLQCTSPFRRCLTSIAHPFLPRYLNVDSQRPIHGVQSHPASSTSSATPSSVRLYSTQPSPPSLLLKTDIPAPHTGHIRILSLNSPRNKNAISKQLLSELSQETQSVKEETEGEWDRFTNEQKSSIGSNGKPETQLQEARVGQGTRALILASNVPGVFCAGADLKERKSMSADETNDFLMNLRQTLTNLENLRIPTISAINGAAFGGGFELALATTFRFITQGASCGLPETRLGIIPGAGGTHRLRRLIGETKALQWILTGKKYHAKQCTLLGACDEVIVDLDAFRERVPALMIDCIMSKPEKKVEMLELEESRLARYVKSVEQEARGWTAVTRRAVEFAEAICHGGPVATMAAMQAVKAGRPKGEGGENEMYEVVRRTKDRDEALVAFAEKRDVVFRGY